MLTEADTDFFLGWPFYVARTHFSADSVHSNTLLYFHAVLLSTVGKYVIQPHFKKPELSL